jgi:hypothetical protein
VKRKEVSVLTRTLLTAFSLLAAQLGESPVHTQRGHPRVAQRTPSPPVLFIYFPSSSRYELRTSTAIILRFGLLFLASSFLFSLCTTPQSSPHQLFLSFAILVIIFIFG